MKQVTTILKRRKWLFIIPFAVVFLVPSVWAFHSMRSYEANSVVWLDPDVSITSVLQGQATSDQGSTPIQQEANTLLQLLQTRSFLTQVIRTTSLQARMDTPSNRAATIAFVQKRIGTAVVGPNSLMITFKGRSPNEALEMVDKTTNGFLDWVRSSAQQQGEQSTQFFADRSAQYRAELDQARTALIDYRKAHPQTRQLAAAQRSLTAPTLTVSPAVQAEYEGLQSQLQYEQQVYDSSLSDLAKTRSLAAATDERYTDGLRLIDKPVLPTSWKKKKALAASLLAFLAAIVIGAALVGVAELGEHTLRDEHDVEDKLGLQVLAVVPQSPQTGGVYD